MAPAPLLHVSDLTVALGPRDARAEVIAGLSFQLEAGRTLGVVGESGCGKSMTALAVMGLLPRPNQVGGRMQLRGADLQNIAAGLFPGWRVRH